MTWDRALVSLGSHPSIDRFRVLCADDNPDVFARDGYRAHVVRLATDVPHPPTDAEINSARLAIRETPPQELAPIAWAPTDGCCNG